MPNPSPTPETLDGSSYARKFRFVLVCPRYTEVPKIVAQQHISPWVIWMWPEIMIYRPRSVIRGVLFPNVARPGWSINAIKPFGVAAVLVIVPVTQLVCDARYVEQSIVSMQRVGGKSENEITFPRGLTNHRLTDGQRQQPVPHARRATIVCCELI